MLGFRGPRFGGRLGMLGLRFRRSAFFSVSHRDAKHAQSDYNHDTIYFHFLLPGRSGKQHDTRLQALRQ